MVEKLRSGHQLTGKGSNDREHKRRTSVSAEFCVRLPGPPDSEGCCHQRCRGLYSKRGRFRSYPWSSYPCYLSRNGKTPSWLARDRVMGSLGLQEGQCKGYEAYMEGRVLELGRPAARKQLQEQWKALRRGWYVGGDSFVTRLADGLEKAAQGRRRESHSGPAIRAHDEAAAEKTLIKAVRALGLNEESLKALPRGSPEKAVLAWWLRENMTVTTRWVSQRLEMGHYTRVTQAISRVSRRPNREHKKLKRKLSDLTNEQPPRS